MKPHASVWTISIAGLAVLGASSAVLAQAPGQSAGQIELSGSCLEQTQQLADLVERDLVDVIDVTSGQGNAAAGGGWALPGSTGGESENTEAASAASNADQAAGGTDVAEQPATAAGSPSEASTVAASTTTSTAQEPAETDPLVLTMANGSTVDLSGKTEEALAAVPQDNWFGQSPDVETAKSYLASAAEVGAAGDEQACLASLEDAKVALGMEEVAKPGESAKQ